MFKKPRTYQLGSESLILVFVMNGTPKIIWQQSNLVTRNSDFQVLFSTFILTMHLEKIGISELLAAKTEIFMLPVKFFKFNFF